MEWRKERKDERGTEGKKEGKIRESIQACLCACQCNEMTVGANYQPLEQTAKVASRNISGACCKKYAGAECLTRRRRVR